MDFENLMITPPMHRDIGSTFLPYSMPMMGVGMPMYPTYGINAGPQLKPIANDKYEKIQQKQKETTNSMKTAFAVLGSILGLCLLIGSKGKIKTRLSNINLFKNISKNKTFRKAKIGLYRTKKTIKNLFSNIINKFKKPQKTLLGLPPAQITPTPNP